MQQTKNPAIRKLAFASMLLALVVVVLGAYVRLNDAGLGCPDWPGCYGHLGVPEAEHHVEAANEAYPERPVEAHKAWKEMVHRYAASTLGLLIVIMAVIAWRQRADGGRPVMPTALVVLVIFQGLLGMWTVTLLVQPIVVTAHLIGGMSTLALLAWVALSHSPVDWRGERLCSRAVKGLALAALIALALQIFLGGWTSTNYAALACYGFPTCNGMWLPEADFTDGFTLWHQLAEGQRDFEGGVLHQAGRVAIQLSHRIGAVIATILVAIIAHLVMFRSQGFMKKAAIATLVALLLQLSLGIGNVYMSLPLWMATAHNAGAALLLLCMVALVYGIFRGVDNDG